VLEGILCIAVTVISPNANKGGKGTGSENIILRSDARSIRINDAIIECLFAVYN
jgi:hypothetical protein